MVRLFSECWVLFCAHACCRPAQKGVGESASSPRDSTPLVDGTLLREQIITGCVREVTVWNRKCACSEEVEVSLVGKGTVSGSLSGVSQLLIE